MPSNLDILAVSDFSRNPFREEVVRRIHGDATSTETVDAVVEIDNQTAAGNTSDGGLEERDEKLQVERVARMELAADQDAFSDDQWEFASALWKSVGKSIGEDAGSKTIVMKELTRIRGRHSNVNTRA